MYEPDIESLINFDHDTKHQKNCYILVINVQNPFLCFFKNQWTLSELLPAIDLSDLRLCIYWLFIICKGLPKFHSLFLTNWSAGLSKEALLLSHFFQWHCLKCLPINQLWFIAKMLVRKGKQRIFPSLPNRLTLLTDITLLTDNNLC